VTVAELGEGFGLGVAVKIPSAGGVFEYGGEFDLFHHEQRRKKLGSACWRIRFGGRGRLGIIRSWRSSMRIRPEHGLHERFGWPGAAHLKQLGFKFNRWLM